MYFSEITGTGDVSLKSIYAEFVTKKMLMAFLSYHKPTHHIYLWGMCGSKSLIVLLLALYLLFALQHSNETLS